MEYSNQTLSTHFVIIEDETGQLLSPVGEMVGEFDYKEVGLPDV